MCYCSVRQAQTEPGGPGFAVMRPREQTPVWPDSGRQPSAFFFPYSTDSYYAHAHSETCTASHQRQWQWPHARSRPATSSRSVRAGRSAAGRARPSTPTIRCPRRPPRPPPQPQRPQPGSPRSRPQRTRPWSPPPRPGSNRPRRRTTSCLLPGGAVHPAGRRRRPRLGVSLVQGPHADLAQANFQLLSPGMRLR